MHISRKLQRPHGDRLSGKPVASSFLLLRTRHIRLQLGSVRVFQMSALVQLKSAQNVLLGHQVT